MVLDRFLMPGMRWYFRRRVNRVIDEINTRLDVEIRPLQITQRRALIDRLVYDEKVLEAVKQAAHDSGMPASVAQDRAMKFAREIVPAFNAYWDRSGKTYEDPDGYRIVLQNAAWPL